MSPKWRVWPSSTWGRVALALCGGLLVVWLSLPAFVQLMERTQFDRFFGMVFVLALAATSLTTVILGFVGIAGKKDKSILLLVSTILIGGILLLSVLGEVIEVMLMSGEWS